MFPFDVILFDIGCVLLTNGWDHRERSIVVEQFKLDGDVLEARHAKAFEAWERGELAADEYLDAVVFYEPRSFSSEEFFSAICAQSKELPNGALCILKELAASDKCRIGAVNNEARETHEYRVKTFGLHTLFQYTFTTNNKKKHKPKTRIYQRA